MRITNLLKGKDHICKEVNYKNMLFPRDTSKLNDTENLKNECMGRWEGSQVPFYTAVIRYNGHIGNAWDGRVGIRLKYVHLVLMEYFKFRSK